LNKITLAIGDGANDVNMIQAAHIGNQNTKIKNLFRVKSVQRRVYGIP